MSHPEGIDVFLYPNQTFFWRQEAPYEKRQTIHWYIRETVTGGIFKKAGDSQDLSNLPQFRQQHLGIRCDRDALYAHLWSRRQKTRWTAFPGIYGKQQELFLFFRKQAGSGRETFSALPWFLWTDHCAGGGASFTDRKWNRNLSCRGMLSVQ